MHWFGGGFITIIIYAAGSNMVDDSKSILTESGNNILTGSGSDIDTES